MTKRGFGPALVWFLVEFYFASVHYLRVQRSTCSGMTIEEVLHTVRERGLINAHRQQLDRDQGLRGVIAFSGPGDGDYGVVLGGPTRDVSEAEVVTLLRQNVLPGHDYRVTFIFTLRFSHWSMAVILNPEGKVKEVQPLRTRD